MASSHVPRDHDPLKKIHENEINQVQLAETVLAAIDMGEELCSERELLPDNVEYTLAVEATNFGSPEVLLPPELLGLIDNQKLSLVILTYNFDSLHERPNLEIRLETQENIFARIARTGIDEGESYRCSFIVNDQDIETKIEPSHVDAFFDQLIVPSLDQTRIEDPQTPAKARDIIDTFEQSQQADVLESRRFEFRAANNNFYKVTLYGLNGNFQEIEIEHVIEDDLSFDTESGDPVHTYRSLIATLAFDEFEQSISFTQITGGQEPILLKNDPELLTMLGEYIDSIKDHIRHRPAAENSPIASD